MCCRPYMHLQRFLHMYALSLQRIMQMQNNVRRRNISFWIDFIHLLDRTINLSRVLLSSTRQWSENNQGHLLQITRHVHGGSFKSSLLSLGVPPMNCDCVRGTDRKTGAGRGQMFAGCAPTGHLRYLGCIVKEKILKTCSGVCAAGT
jgi:hypothetical protein